MSEKIKLGEIIDTIQGSQYPLDEQITEYKEGYLRFLRISDYTKSDEPIRYVKYSGKELVSEENEVVVVRYGNVGFIGYGKKGILANNLFVLRLKNEKFDSKYLYYYLNSPNINNAIVNKANSSTMPALTHKMIKDLEIPIVDIEKQKCIVNELDKIQKIIDIREEQIEYFDELIKSQFVEMFERGQYPKDEFINIAKEIYAGGDKPKDISKVQDDEYLYPVFANGYENEGLQGYSKSYRTGDNAVTISARGTIGYSFIRNEKFTPIVRLITIIPNEKANIVYLKYAIDNLNIAGSGTSQAQLTVPDIKKKKIIIPPIELQNKFADIVKQIDKQKFEIENSLKEMQELYESLMEKYFG